MASILIYFQSPAHYLRDLYTAASAFGPQVVGIFLL